MEEGVEEGVMGKDKKKVLFVATVDSVIEQFNVPFLKLFKDSSYEVHVATNSNRPIKYCDKKIKLSITRNPFTFSNVKAVRELKDVLKREKYDIIHCHTPMGGVVARVAAKKSRKDGTRVIYTAHGFHFYDGAPIHNWLMFYPVEKYLAKYTDTLITINMEDYERAKKKFCKRCRDIQYVSGVGVDEKKFEKKLSAKERKEIRESLGLEENDKVLICVGRLDKNKNQGFLIDVMKILVEKDSRCHLLLVGVDELGGKYQKKVKEMKLENNVHFLGFRDDITNLLQISDIVLSASGREGLPLNLVEASFAGVPIVATDCRGNRDICRVAGGLISKQGDKSTFIKNVLKKIKSNKETRDMSEFSLENVSKKMKEIYGFVNSSRKIMFVGLTMGKGGAERVMSILANEFSKNDVVSLLTVVNGSDSYRFDPRVKRLYVDKKSYDLNNKFKKIAKKLSVVRSLRLKKIILRESPDVVVVFLPEPSLRLMLETKLSRKLRKIPIIISVRNDPKVEYKNSLIRFIMKKIYANVSGMVYQTEDAKKFFRGFIKTKNQVVISNPIDEKTLVAPKVDGLRRDVVISVGRLEKQKNQKMLIRAFSEAIKDKRTNYKMEIYGKGTLREDLYDLIHKLGMDEKISLKGQTDDIISRLNSSKIFVLSSSYEGLPNVLIEAMAMGLPVISTDCPCGGPRSIIEDGKNGILVKNEDERAMARAISKLMEDENVREKLAKEALLIRESNSIGTIVMQWSNLINKVIGKKWIH